VQTDQSILGIRFMFSVFPTVFSLLGVVAILFYKIDNEMLGNMARDLQLRRGEADTNPT
jgi:GPH family glycoside/pentoside/hexuronide:cation symporter